MKGAVAVDLGASSGRFAAGRFVGGRIEFEVIKQVAHAPVQRNARLEWNLDAILGLCREAADYAAFQMDDATLGIDTWGVDHGFLTDDGDLLQAPVCYRDLSHVRAFESLAPHRTDLYRLTGCQHQPFNTICQLVARRAEGMSTSARWMVLPDLLGHLLAKQNGTSAGVHHELTQASTTQLLGLDGMWSRAAFEIAGWPVPTVEPELPGLLGLEVAPEVRLAHVGSHDTASAVCGLGGLTPDTAFLNVGTWSLFGAVVAHPIASPEAESGNWTNERSVDGRVRFLKNIPGFYVINRVHEELGIEETVDHWLEGASRVEQTLDLMEPDLYNPASMVDTCERLLGRRPAGREEWAGLLLGSLVAAVAEQVPHLSSHTAKPVAAIRVGGGGSQSSAFCQALSAATHLPVIAGPAEATVLGNLAMQLLASGGIVSHEQMQEVVLASCDVVRFG